MQTLRIDLDEPTLQRARQRAESQNSSLEEMVSTFVERLGREENPGDLILGLFSDDPELIDAVLDSAMRARETHPLRNDGR